MSIVAVTCPGGVTRVTYGAIAFQPSGAELDVPAYVAKTLITLAGFSCAANLAPSYDTLIASTNGASLWELNYLFYAWGKNPNPTIVAAQALMDASGAPAVGAS